MAAPTDEAAPVTEAGAAGFQIEGRQYPVPPIDTFTFDELETLYRYCGLTITDWGRRHTPEGAERWEELSTKPGFYMCLVHVAYRRGNRETPDETVAALVRDLQWLDVMAPLFGQVDDEDLQTPGTTNVPERSSGRKPSSSDSSKPASGTSSPTASEKAATPDAGTGTGGSDTSATPIRVRQVI